MSGGGGDGGGQFPTNPWSNAPGPAGGADGPGGGGVGGPAGGPGVPDDVAGQDACEALIFTARLRNVDADELALVSVGDVLSVEYRSDPTPSVAVFRPGSGVQLGALAERLGELLPCLQLLEFVAEVLVVDGGNTKVEVRPA